MRLQPLLVIAAGCGRIAFDEAEPLGGPGAVITRLAINNTVTERLDSIPVMVALSGSRVDRAKLGTGTDLRFRLGSKVLAFEIETLGTVTQPPIVWLRIPELVPGIEPPPIFMIYGDGEQVDPKPVWGEEHVGVWHFDGDTKDSSLAQNHAEPMLAEPTVGQFGNAANLQGTVDASLLVDDNASLQVGTAVTASGWINLRTYRGGYNTILSRQYALGSTSDDFFLGTHDGNAFGYMAGAPNVDCDSTTTVPLDTWTFLALTYNGSDEKLYVDGRLVTTMPFPGPLAHSARPLLIGASSDSDPAGQPDTDFMDGRLDEVRLESVARPAEWIRIQYASMTDALITYE